MDFIKGKIYKIECNVTGKIYIGSTTKTLEQRLACHLKKSNHCTSREVTASGDFKIELIEEYKCQTRDQLRIREQYWMLGFDCVNKHRAFQTPEQKREYDRNWKQCHFEQHRELQRNWCKIRTTCECGADICNGAKSTHLKTKRHRDFISAKHIDNNATVEKTETTHST